MLGRGELLISSVRERLDPFWKILVCQKIFAEGGGGAEVATKN